MRRIFKQYITRSSLDKQIKLMFTANSLFIFLLIIIGYLYTTNSQKNLEYSYNNHVLPLKDFNEIRNIYEINILDTMKDFNQGYISKDDAKEVLILSHKLLEKEWRVFLQNNSSGKKNNHQFRVEEYNSLLKVLKSLELLISSLSQEDDKKIQQVLDYNVRPDILSALERINDFVDLEVIDMQDSIRIQNKNFKDIISYVFPLLCIFYIVLLIYIRNILKRVQNTNQELYNSKQEIQLINDNLEKKVELRTKELELAKEHAEELSKTKSYFLANMSHEIRTPMSGILGLTHLLLKTNLANKQRNYLLKIESSTNTLLQIINDILDISKIEAGKLFIEKANFDLFEVIENSINLIELKAKEKQLELTVDYQVDVGKEFFGDSLRISQILTNLLSNAIKFTHHGEIALTVSKIAYNRIRFDVTDTGIGLTQSQMDKIFESFTQADETTTKKYGGTGLGLSITKQLVELMNGSITVQSKFGMGTTFSFDLELEKEDLKDSYTIFSNKKVLIVDDSQSWLDILKYLMVSFGLEVTTVLSGEDAINLVKTETVEFDLFLIDCDMPKIDGIETCKILHHELQIDSNKFILVSSHRQEDLIDDINNSCTKRFLHKPINPSLLNDMLSEIFLNKKVKTSIEKKDKLVSLEQKLLTLRGSKILLVDDNKINQEIFLGLLEESGIVIDIANNGLDAIEKFENNNYELIFMDIQMPILDGYEATRRIRLQNVEIPIVALTADAMKEDIEKTKNVGMNQHLNKPIDVKKLYEVLLHYLSKKVELNLDTVLKSDIENTNKDDSLPEFESLDKEYALKLLLGNEKAFKTLLKGLVKYKDIDFKSLDDEEYKRKVHSLKGLCASAGAHKLYELAKELELNENENLLDEFILEFHKVVNEIEIKICNTEEQELKKEISLVQKEKLFNSLKEAVFTKRIQSCRPVIDELSKVSLTQEEENFLKEIVVLIEKFKFKDAMERFN